MLFRSLGYCQSLCSVQFLDAEKGELVVLAADGQADAVAGIDAGVVEQRGIGEDGHQLHRRHAEGGDRFVPDEDEVGGGARRDHAPHFVRGRAQDGGPQRERERGDQRDEDRRDQPACAAGGPTTSGQRLW